MGKNRQKRVVERKTTSTSIKSIGTRMLSLVAGLAAGTFVKNFIAKKDVVSGTDLLGLDGNTSAYTTPAIVTAAGFALMHFSKNEMLKDVAMGVMASGGAGLVNAVAGKSLVALGATEDMPTVPLLPGIGDVYENIRYDLLPTENEQVQTYNPVKEAGDIVEGVEPVIL